MKLTLSIDKHLLEKARKTAGVLGLSLNEMIRNGGFAMIAVDHRIDERAAFDEFQWWPAGTREAMQARYRLDRRLEDLYLYVPDPASASQESPRAAR